MMENRNILYNYELNLNDSDTKYDWIHQVIKLLFENPLFLCLFVPYLIGAENEIVWYAKEVTENRLMNGCLTTAVRWKIVDMISVQKRYNIPPAKY